MHRGSRPGAAVLLCGALLILPLVLIRNGPVASASPTDEGGSAYPSATGSPADAGAASLRLTSATSKQRSRTARATTPTTVTVPPTTTTTPVPQDPAVSPVRAVTPQVVPLETTTTVTVPPTTTTTRPVAATPPAEGAHYGQVTYYAHPAGTCASPFLAFGTVVEITNPANGLSVSCVVNDREADTERSIDLATASFAELAPLSQGVIDAELSW